MFTRKKVLALLLSLLLFTACSESTPQPTKNPPTLQASLLMLRGCTKEDGLLVITDPETCQIAFDLLPEHRTKSRKTGEYYVRWGDKMWQTRDFPPDGHVSADRNVDKIITKITVYGHIGTIDFEKQTLTLLVNQESDCKTEPPHYGWYKFNGWDTYELLSGTMCGQITFYFPPNTAIKFTSAISYLGPIGILNGTFQNLAVGDFLAVTALKDQIYATLKPATVISAEGVQ